MRKPPHTSGRPRVRQCPICRAPLLAMARPHAPFCSARCRMVDLGRWLGGEYAVPGEEAPLEAAGGDED